MRWPVFSHDAITALPAADSRESMCFERVFNRDVRKYLKNGHSPKVE